MRLACGTVVCVVGRPHGQNWGERSTASTESTVEAALLDATSSLGGLRYGGSANFPGFVPLLEDSNHPAQSKMSAAPLTLSLQDTLPLKQKSFHDGASARTEGEQVPLTRSNSLTLWTNMHCRQIALGSVGNDNLTGRRMSECQPVKIDVTAHAS